MLKAYVTIINPKVSNTSIFVISYQNVINIVKEIKLISVCGTFIRPELEGQDEEICCFERKGYGYLDSINVGCLVSN